MQFASVDLGATSGRVMVAQLDAGRLTLREAHRFRNNPIQDRGAMRWDLPGIWREVKQGLLMAPGPIASIGVDAWGVDCALLDRDGALLENPYHYRDSRTEGMVEEVTAIISPERLYEATGIQTMRINTLFQLYATKKQNPELLAGARSLLLIPEMMNYWLTGIRASEYTAASTTQMLHPLTRMWNTGLLTELGIPTHLLERIDEPGTVLGPVTGDLRGSALREAMVVAPACHDTGSAVAAVEAGHDTAFLSTGTWFLLGAETPRPFLTAAARQWNFTNEGGVGGTIRLLRNITGLWLLEGCLRKWEVSDYGGLIESAKVNPAFSHLIDPDDPLFINPPDMTAAIDHYCEATGQPAPGTRGAYVRAILESLALKARVVLEQLESITGARYSRLRVMGGGSKNAVLNQFIADACGRPVLAGPAEATAIGNAMMQMLALGCVGSIQDARGIVQQSFPPVVYQPEAASRYAGAFDRYRDLIARRLAIR